ncbi:MAG TPA: hypothetical protein VGE52_16925 [Pirellulales bacterium]
MNAAKKNTPKRTAEDAYVAAHLTATELLAKIQTQLQDLPAPQTTDQPIHWGHVGDVNHINELLQQVAEFLARRESRSSP